MNLPKYYKDWVLVDLIDEQTDDQQTKDYCFLPNSKVVYKDNGANKDFELKKLNSVTGMYWALRRLCL